MKKKYNITMLKYVMAKLKINPSTYRLNDDAHSRNTVNYVRRVKNKWETGVFDGENRYDRRKYDSQKKACYAFLEEFYPEGLHIKAKWLRKKVTNIKELRVALKKSGVRKSYYVIYPDKEYHYDTMSYIKPIPRGWEIGVFERGNYYDVQKFKSEAKACQAFLEDLLRYGSLEDK